MSKPIKLCPLSNYYTWQKLDQLEKPINNDHTGFKQLHIVTIKHMVNRRENYAYVFLDRALYIPEWTLQYTTSIFRGNLMTRFNLNSCALYYTLEKCLQGNTLTVWDELIVEEYPNNSDQTTVEFDTALTRYLKKVAGIGKMKDNLFHWLRNWKNSFLVDISEYAARLKQLHRYEE